MAELSLNSVTGTAGPQEQVFHQLEIELIPAMPESLLIELVQHLQNRWDLQSERLSKFERGLAMKDYEVREAS